MNWKDKTMKPRVVAVILNYESADLTCSCADELLSRYSGQLDLLIVDNNSSKGVDVLKSYCSSRDVKLIASKSNGGYSSGNNIGLRYAYNSGYEFALIVNPDVVAVSDDLIDKAISVFDSNAQIAVVAPDVLHSAGYRQNPMREPCYFEELLWPLELIKGKFSSLPAYHLDPSQSGVCEKVSGCCFFVRMSFLAEVDFLDEGVFLYCEEPILAAKVKQAGYIEYYMSDTRVLHNHKRGNDLSSSNLNRLLRSREYYLRNYSGYNEFKLKILLFSLKVKNKFFSHLGGRNQ